MNFNQVLIQLSVIVNQKLYTICHFGLQSHLKNIQQTNLLQQQQLFTLPTNTYIIKHNMHRLVTSLSKIIVSHHSQTKLLFAAMSGLKLRANKKSSSTVFAELSSEYLQKYNEDHSKDKSIKDNAKKNANSKSSKNEEQELMEIQQLKDSWLGNALEDDLLVETKEWEGDVEMDLQAMSADKTVDRTLSQQQSQQQGKKTASQSQKNPNNHSFPTQAVILKVKSFKKQLTKTQLIANSRKFLEIICNIFPRHQVQRIIAQLKQFCQKRDLNIPSLVSLNIQNQKSPAINKKNQHRKLQKEMKIIQKITKQRQKKLFIGVRKIFDQTLTDIELIDNLLSLLSQSDPYIMNSEDIHKLIYSHQEGVFDDEASHHKAEINVILDKKQRQSLFTQKEEQKAIIDELISPNSRKEFLKQADQMTVVNNNSQKRPSKQGLDEQSQQDLINVFEQFSMQSSTKQQPSPSRDKPLPGKQHINSESYQSRLQRDKQRQQKRLNRSMKLIVKRNINQMEQKPAIPQQFQINQHSLHEIERILFKNKKIVEDNVVFKKVKAKSMSAQITAEREEFGRNWIYAYEMPYALDHAGCQQFIDFVADNYGEIIQYYIFPYKNMLEKRENIMIYIENQKKLIAEQKQKEQGNIKDKPLVADKLLEKIQKEKNLQLNKSSIVFKFKNLQSKSGFLMPEMRLYGLNFKTFRNVRFEQAQSKKIIAISMIPWGCSSEDLLKAINKALKPIDVEVSYQSCILAKGFIFVEFDNFYECLNACQLLNNLQFQGHSLKVQINYGSSKIYGEKYKNALQFDHYETLVKKLKDIKCFYNEVYQD